MTEFEKWLEVYYPKVYREERTEHVRRKQKELMREAWNASVQRLLVKLDEYKIPYGDDTMAVRFDDIDKNIEEVKS